MKKRICLCASEGYLRLKREDSGSSARVPTEGGLDAKTEGSKAASPGMGLAMTNEKQPVTIKKYANRRLYNTGASAYVTLEDLAEMVKIGEDFVVYDAKSGDDITRSVLAQIIFEQEGKTGENLMPIRFLRQLIRFYGDSMQKLVPSYLEFSIERLTTDGQKFREQFEAAVSANPLANPTRQIFQSMEEQARKNMAMFREALDMFSPFVAAGEPGKTPQPSDELNEMRAQLAEMQKRIDSLVKKD